MVYSFLANYEYKNNYLAMEGRGFIFLDSVIICNEPNPSKSDLKAILDLIKQSAVSSGEGNEDDYLVSLTSLIPYVVEES